MEELNTFQQIGLAILAGCLVTSFVIYIRCQIRLNRILATVEKLKEKEKAKGR